MKRTFLIPLSGVALVGCGDPIIATWNGVEYYGEALPLTYTYTNANGVSCDNTLNISMQINDNLAGEINLSYSTVCADGTTVDDSYNVPITITVVDKKKQYSIVVEGDSLNCDMNNNVDLVCDGADGEPDVVKFKAAD